MMKFLRILPVVLLMHATAFAQAIPPKSIEDAELGWMKVYNFTGVRPPVTVDDKHYTAAQLAYADAFANWIQASYLPKGGLGDVLLVTSPKLSVYTLNDAALPQTYGVYAKTYTELKYDANRKMVPLTDSHVGWSVLANGLFGYPTDNLNTPTLYYFTLPSFEEAGYSLSPNDAKYYDWSTHPSLKKYVSYYQRDTKYGNAENILLAKDGKSPFVTVTKGEYLQAVEGAVARLYESEKKSITEKAHGDQRDIDYFMAALNEKNDKRIAVLRANREKYKDRLQETAEIVTLQPDAMLENSADVFEGNGGRHLRLPVYKIDPATAERCKDNGPQWMVVMWRGNVNDPVGAHLYDAVVNNFDFDYLYDYVFNPEKVKGRPYQPLHSPLVREAAVVTDASDAAKKNAADAGVYFFEDFSTTGVGRKPAAWSSGTHSLVAGRDGLPGNWAVMEGDSSAWVPKELKMPLPRNFTLSYDLVVPKGFTWGAKGLTFVLANERPAGNPVSFLRLKLRPGFDGRDGEADIETKFPAGYAKGEKWVAATGFSNDKANNRISVSIRKTGETLQVFIDSNKIDEYDKAMPADSRVQRAVVRRARFVHRRERQVLRQQHQDRPGALSGPARWMSRCPTPALPILSSSVPRIGAASSEPRRRSSGEASSPGSPTARRTPGNSCSASSRKARRSTRRAPRRSGNSTSRPSSTNPGATTP